MDKMKNSTPKFSILMPTFNRADIIGFAIESVLAQIEKNFELLIVGDGCTDNTAQVVKKYLKDKRVKWFDFPKAPGFGYANRNKALKQAKGTYIGFAAHDDILFPDHLEILSKYLDENKNLDIVYSRSLWVDESGIILPSSFNLLDKDIFNYFMTTGNGIAASNFIHRRSCFDKVGYWNEKLEKNADWDMWKRIIKSSGKDALAFEPMPTVFHFKAIWRTEANLYPTGLNIIAPYIKKSPESLPSSLSVKIPKGKTEQEIFPKKISKEKNWLSELRKGSTTLLDHLIQVQMPKMLEDVEAYKRWVAELESSKGSNYLLKMKRLIKRIILPGKGIK